MAQARDVDRRDLLKSLHLFSSLDGAAIDELLKLMMTKKLKAKEVLLRKGDEGRQLYCVLGGRLKVSAAGADGKEVVFGIMDPGEVFGEIALLDNEPRSATVVAMEPCDLLTLHRRDLNPFLISHPDVLLQLAEILAARVRRLSELMEDTLFLALPSRLAKKLLSLGRRYGVEEPDGLKISIKLPQQELGEMVGTSRESINKQLRGWVEDGLIAVDRGFITIRDRDGLDHLARLLMF